MNYDEVGKLISRSTKEIAGRWLELHLAETSVRADEEIVRAIHGRSRSMLSALALAISSASPMDWGSFSHREVVQIVTLMARSLAQAGATGTTAGALIPALGKALEIADVDEVVSILMPLSVVVSESYTAGRLAALHRRAMAQLVETTPILKLRQELLLIAAYGAPDRDTALALSDRVMRAVIALKVDSPVVVLDISNLLIDEIEPEALSVLLLISEEITALGGSFEITGVAPKYREVIERNVSGIKGIAIRESLEKGLASLWPEGLLHKLGRALR